MKVSIVIPIYPPHFHLLPSLINQIEKQTEKPDEIIIAASETTTKTIYEYLSNINITILRIIKVITSDNKQFAGINRNMGIKKAIGDIIIFMDADDIYHKRKIEISKKLYEKHNYDLLIHSYGNKNQNIDNITINDNYNILTTDEIYMNTFKNGRNINEETGYQGNTNLWANFPIHHGVITISKKMRKYEYTDLRMGEDGKFCRDILYDKNKVIMVNLKLMSYQK